MDGKKVQEVFERLEIFDKMYEVIRFVDPVAKRVIGYKKNALNGLAIKCFDFWDKSERCNNCVSLRAFNENKTFVKIEYTPERIYMVTAMPFELADRRIVIELMKDMTNNMVFENGQSEIYQTMESMDNLALKDPLTGIYNRRYINEKLAVDMVSAALSGQDISIIMADIDFFKIVNDTYGHLAGDEVLKSFAGTISGSLKRESDWVARFGGEEFLICLPGAGIQRAAEVAEKLRKAVEAKEIILGGNAIHITASFGVCSIKPMQGSKIGSFIECADKRLYAAKNNGRNRVEV